MKFANIFSLIVILGYVDRSSALTMVEPISYVLQIKYNLPFLDWESSCNNAYNEIKKLQTQAGTLSIIELPKLILAQMPNPKLTEGLDDLVQKYCGGNPDVQKLSRNVVFNVKQCTTVELDKKINMKNDLVKSLCANVKSSVEWEIQSNKFVDN